MLKVVEEEKLLHNVLRYIGKSRYLFLFGAWDSLLTTLFILLVLLNFLAPFIAQGWSGFGSALV